MSYTGVPGGRERTEREQQAAHRAYHDAFAKLDAIVNETARAMAALGEIRDAASRELAEMLQRVATFESLLVLFLQQVTPYIDTKVRAVEQHAADAVMTATAAQRAAVAAERAARDAGAEAGGTGVGLTDAGVGRTFRSADDAGVAEEADGGANPAVARTFRSAGRAAAARDNAVDAALYVGFEDLFRGTESEIRARQAGYLPLFSGARDVLDLGCGRGEFLALLAEAGISARGIDLNEEMVAACRERGLEVQRADAVSHLRSLPAESLGGLFAAQVVEHLQPPELLSLLREASRVLRPNARLVLETINPTCWVAFFEGYLRDLTHARPLHPDTLKFLTVASGFRDVEVRYRSPIPEDGRLRRLPPQPAPAAGAPQESRVLADLVEAFNLNMERLNDRMFTHLDYAVVGVRG